MSNPGFKPEFGPNGAVMNAPTMTPKMRAEIEQAARPATAGDMRRAGLFVLLLVIAILPIVVFSKDLINLAQASPWWAGAFTGAMAVALAASMFVNVRAVLLRWELIGPGARDRRLRMPMWGRWLLASLYAGFFAAWATAMLVFFRTFGAGMTSYVYLVFCGGLLMGGLASTLESVVRRWGWMDAAVGRTATAG